MKKKMWLHLLLAFFVLSLAGSSDAAVTLKGYTDNSDEYQYVLFGRFPQKFLSTTLPTTGVENKDWVKVERQYSAYGDIAFFSIDPIEWRVLGASQTGMLMLSDKVMDQHAFHGDQTNNNYGISGMRAYLSGGNGTTNGDSGGWLDTSKPYFHETERNAMVLYSYGAYKDKLFLLSQSDADQDSLRNVNYGFSATDEADTNRIGYMTDYRENYYQQTQTEHRNVWWTRSPGAIDFEAWAVGLGGDLNDLIDVIFGLGVRPAFFLDLESVIFKSGSAFGSTAPATAGKSSDPFLLYLSMSSKTPPSVAVNGDVVTITFAAGVQAVHAYTDTPDATGLAERFEVTVGAANTPVPVVSASVDGSGVVTLKLGQGIGSSESDIRVAYSYEDDCTDGIGFISDVTALDAFNVTTGVANNTKINFNPAALSITGSAGSAIAQTQVTATTTLPATITTVTPDANKPSWLTVAGTDTITFFGMPTAAGSGSFVIAVADSAGNTSSLPVTYTISSSGGGPGPGPDPTDSAQSLSTLLSSLNTALSPKALVAGLTSIPAGLGTPITKAVPGNATFAKKDAPAAAFPGYTALAPSFSSSVTLNADTTGNVLALKYTAGVASLSGFENWGNMTDAQRAALLDSLKVIFAYEYADKTWKTLVGAGGVLSWADALKAGIASFTATGIGLNYAVTDATGDPAASGSVLAIPDGAKDNRIVDPVWLLRAEGAEPAAVTIDLSGLGLVNNVLEIEPREAIDLRIESDPAGAAFAATGLPQGLTLASDGRLHGAVPQAGTYNVTATATLNGETASETFTIEVKAQGAKGHSSSGGCNAGLGGLALAALCLGLASAPLRARGM